MQTIKDPIIYSIEIISGTVIQSIGEQNAQRTNVHKPFTLSPCGSHLFTSNNNAIECWHCLNDKKMAQIQISISLDSTFISSLSYHPNKFLMACSVYGDASNVCMLLLNYENNDLNQMNDSNLSNYDRSNDLDRDLMALERWNCARAKTLYENGNTLHTFNNILNRIDDLFFMAIKSPNRTDDYKQRKQYDKLLEKLENPIQFIGNSEFDSNESLTEIESNDPLKSLNRNANAEQTIESLDKQTNDNRNDSESTFNSNHTYVVEKIIVNSNNNNEQNKNDVTYEIDDSKSFSNNTNTSLTDEKSVNIEMNQK